MASDVIFGPYSSTASDKTDINSIIVDATCFNGTDSIFNAMQHHLSSLTSQLNSMNLLDNQTNDVYDLSIGLITAFSQMIITMITENNGFDHLEAVKLSSEFVTSALSKYSTSFKRKREIRCDSLYVEPQTKAIGTRTEVIRLKQQDIAIPQLLQCTYQFVSIVDTMKSLFSNAEFRQVYKDFNMSKHICEPGVYRGVCCGSTYQGNTFFKDNPLSMEIMLAGDDVEICNAIGSKATIHKQSMLYMSIRNMPIENSSQLNNIFVVAACNADDLRTKETDFNDIWRQVVQDIRFLEEVGIEVEGFGNLKGTLACYTFDNLGANTALGFVESFRSHYSCRICEMSRDDCKLSCKENLSMYRTKETYAEQLEIISKSEKVDFKKTKGVKRYCVLNDLQYFHIFENLHGIY